MQYEAQLTVHSKDTINKTIYIATNIVITMRASFYLISLSLTCALNIFVTVADAEFVSHDIIFLCEFFKILFIQK